MAAVSDSSKISDGFNKISIEDNGSVASENESKSDNNPEYGLPLIEVYKLALNFYKGSCLIKIDNCHI